MNILVINGPNMQLLGMREPEIYGKVTLGAVNDHLRLLATSLEVELDFFQSNHEGEIVDRIGNCLSDGTDGIIINPAAYSHTSIAIHDALKAVAKPAIEVHISNISSRESFRSISMTSPACIGLIAGLGIDGYEWGVRAMVKYLLENKQKPGK